MKILHLIYDHVENPWVGGGGAFRCREIYRRLSARHDITVVCGKYPGAKDYDEDGVRYRFAGTGRDNYVLSTFSYAWRATRYLRAHARGADIVIEDFAPWNPLFGYRLRQRPVVVQLQNYLGIEILRKYFVLGLPFWLAEKFLPRRFKNSIVMVNSLIGRFSLRGRTGVISNGFDSAYLEIPETVGEHLLYMGRIDIHQKGLDTLAKALALAGVRLLVAGGGEVDKFMGLCKNADVELAGYVQGERKIEVLNNAAALVLPSRYEGQGIVVLEAAALGTPVIVSDIPELAYAVEAGFGLSFKSNDAKDLAEKMQYLLDNPSVRAEMGQRAKRYARDFTWDSIAERYERFLHETAGVDV